MTSNKHICNEGGKENVWPSEIDEDGRFYFSKKKKDQDSVAEAS